MASSLVGYTGPKVSRKKRGAAYTEFGHDHVCRCSDCVLEWVDDADAHGVDTSGPPRAGVTVTGNAKDSESRLHIRSGWDSEASGSGYESCLPDASSSGWGLTTVTAAEDVSNRSHGGTKPADCF